MKTFSENKTKFKLMDIQDKYKIYITINDMT